MMIFNGGLDAPATSVPVLYMAPQFGGGGGGETPTYSNERDRGVWLSWAFSGFRKRNQRKTLD